MMSIENAIQSAKEILPDVTPTPPGFHPHASAHELKSRLDFGEPALTIFDVRDRTLFLDCRIMGAMSLPLESLQSGERPRVDFGRDIYVYGNTNEETNAAANLMRSMGFTRVAELRGGLSDWLAIAGSVEGYATSKDKRTADEYNIIARLKAFSRERTLEAAIKSKQI